MVGDPLCFWCFKFGIYYLHFTKFPLILVTLMPKKFLCFDILRLKVFNIFPTQRPEKRVDFARKITETNINRNYLPIKSCFLFIYIDLLHKYPSITNISKKESPPAWTQDANCPPPSKCLLCCSIPGETPHPDLAGETPVLSLMGVLHPDLARGTLS